MDRYLLRSILGTLSSDAMNYFFPGFVWKEENHNVLQEEAEPVIRFRESPDEEVRFSVTEKKQSNYSDVLLEECALDLPSPGGAPVKIKKLRTVAKKPKVKKDESLLETSMNAVRSIILEPKPIDLELDERTLNSTLNCNALVYSFVHNTVSPVIKSASNKLSLPGLRNCPTMQL